ncbi:MAG: PP2C family serine/threonine-protein phosphatase [Candidatus Tectimicrobiota bacterium]
MLTSTVAVLSDNTGHGEDSYVVRALGPAASLDAVMDGVTGRRGWEASQVLAEALNTASLQTPDDLLAVLADINQQLYRRGWGRFLLTTISAALCVEDRLSVIGAGDSPVLLIRADTSRMLSSRTSGFSPLAPMRAIGASQHLGTLYRAEITLEPGDRLLLATDGVTDTLARTALEELIRCAASPEEAVRQLHTALAIRYTAAQAGGAAGRRDDETAILRFFTAG